VRRIPALGTLRRFALFGQVGPERQVGIAVAVYPLLLIASHPWLKAFSIGPMEWVLRSITQMRLVALR
jgi:uncharacterized protein